MRNRIYMKTSDHEIIEPDMSDDALAKFNISLGTQFEDPLLSISYIAVGVYVEKLYVIRCPEMDLVSLDLPASVKNVAKCYDIRGRVFGLSEILNLVSRPTEREIKTYELKRFVLRTFIQYHILGRRLPILFNQELRMYRKYCTMFYKRRKESKWPGRKNAIKRMNNMLRSI